MLAAARVLAITNRMAPAGQSVLHMCVYGQGEKVATLQSREGGRRAYKMWGSTAKISWGQACNGSHFS